MINHLKSILFLLINLFIITNVIGQNDPFIVHPGDANNNGVVNGVDMLWWGVSYGETGESRINDTIEWDAYVAPDVFTWDSMPALYDNLYYINRYHADCNGKGIVDELDVLAFIENHNRQHGILYNDIFVEGTLGVDPILDFDFLSTNIYNPGDSISIPIVLGSEDIPVEEFHGITFSIEFDEAYIDTEQVTFTYNNEWVGEEFTEVQVLRTWDNSSVFNITITRKNLQNVLGSGGIGKLDVVIEGNVPDRRPDTEVAQLKRAKVVNRDLEEIEIALDNLTINLGEEKPASILYPNPIVGNILQVNLFEVDDIKEYQIFDNQGRNWEVREADNNSINVSHLPSGFYFLNIRVPNKGYFKTHKFIVNQP